MRDKIVLFNMKVVFNLVNLHFDMTCILLNITILLSSNSIFTIGLIAF